MLDLEVVLWRMRQREMLAAVERERLFRRARRAAREQRAQGERPLALVGGGPHVASWRLWLGRRLIQWGAVLAADSAGHEADLGQVCC